MTETNEATTVLRTGSITLSRVEAAAVLGAALVLVSMPLPWVSGLMGSTSGYAYGPVSPVFAGGAVLAAVLALPGPYPRSRYVVLSLLGTGLAGWGMVLLLGIPAGAVGIGVPLFTVGGLLVVGGGYTALCRETSTLKATAVVCVGGLVVNTSALIAVAG